MDRIAARSLTLTPRQVETMLEGMAEAGKASCPYYVCSKALNDAVASR